MTDDLDPSTGQGTADDETTRVSVPPAPDAATPPTESAQATVSEATPAAPAAPAGRSRRPCPLTPASRPDGAATVYENEVAWATAAPVVVTGSKPPRRRSRLRWAAAIAVVALVIGASAAAAALLTGSSSTGDRPRLRPGAHRRLRRGPPRPARRPEQAVGEFLSKFPGFADQAALDTKLDEVLDELVRDASNGKQTYTGNIKPWFDGELAFSVGPLPPAASLKGADPSSLSSFRHPRPAVGQGSRPRPRPGSTMRSRRPAPRPPPRPTTASTMTSSARRRGPTAAYALIDGKVAVVGDLTSVKAAIDTNGDGGFANEPGPKAALRLVERRPRRLRLPGPRARCSTGRQPPRRRCRSWVAALPSLRPSASRS